MCQELRLPVASVSPGNPVVDLSRSSRRRTEHREWSTHSPSWAVPHLTLFAYSRQVYRTSVGGFLRLLLGLSLLDNPRNETIILEQLSQSTSIASNSSATSAIIDALDEFAKLHEEQNQARGMLSLENGDETATQLADSPFNEKEDVIEELGRGSRHGEGDVVSSIKSTIERLRRRID